jgi:hypothetical protein
MISLTHVSVLSIFPLPEESCSYNPNLSESHTTISSLNFRIFRIRLLQHISTAIHNQVTHYKPDTPRSWLENKLSSYFSQSKPSLPSHSILAPPSNHMSIPIKHIRNRSHENSDTPQNRKRPMRPHILIKRHSHNRHSASYRVPGHGNEGESRGGIDLVRVDDVHIG